jgi:subtilisin family serine protease
MMAGIVHLVAPHARILPIKAFSSDCTARIADVINAIYHAVDAHVDVISGSWDTPVDSPELDRAIAYAASNGVVFAAAAGNNSSNVPVFPASINPTISVAATTNSDYLSSYSDFGSWVTLGAPGDAILTTFPQNRYALGWGTSPSTAWVSGTAALILSVNHRAGISDVTKALQQGADHARSAGLGAGRLNVYGSVNAGKQ